MIQIINITSPRTPHYWKDFPKDTKHLMTLNNWIAVPYNMGLLAVIVHSKVSRKIWWVPPDEWL